MSIYENLPSGGARTLYLSNLKSFKKSFTISHISDRSDTSSINNIFQYLYYVYFKQFRIRMKNSEIIANSKIFISYHSWLSKSTILLRQKLVPEIYVCHEPPREFYDIQYMHMFNLKEIIVNVLRYGIKIIDKLNISYNNKLLIISNSKYSKKIIDKIYGVSSKVIYPGIKLSEFGQLQSLKNRENIILSVGSINKIKNQVSILQIISKLDIKVKYKVVFAGNGGDDKYIKSLIKIAHKSKIKLEIYKNISHASLISLYKRSKLFVYTPINEPFGIVILEAMRAGLPIIANVSGGGYTEVFNKFSGKLLALDAYNMWNKWINDYLTNQALWNHCSKYNYTYSEKFSEDNMNLEFTKQINNLISPNL